MEDREGRNGEEFVTLTMRHRVLVSALVAVMVFSGLTVLVGSRGAAAAGTSGPLIFKAATTTLAVTTTNVLNIGYVDEFQFIYASYDTLLSLDGDLSRVNWLAYKYDTPAVIGGNTYRFYLVQDACFFDPTSTIDPATYCAQHPVTANDVVFTYNMLLCLHGVSAPPTATSCSRANPSRSLDSYVERFAGARWVSKYIVDLSFSQTYAPWFSTFSAIPILPEYVWGPVFANGTGDPTTYVPPVVNGVQGIVGSGPLMTIKADQTIEELRKNQWGLRGPWWGTSDYNLEIRPDVVQYIAYGTQENSKLALLRGDVDLDLDPGTTNYLGSFIGATVGGLPVQRYALATQGFIYEIPNVNVADARIRSTSSRYAHGNTNPALLRQDVRTAIHQVVDPSQLNSQALQGLGKVGESFIPTGNPWHYDVPAAQEKNFDPAGARLLLNANGWVYNGTYAEQNNGALKLEPGAAVLAADWVCNGDGEGTAEGRYKGTPGADANGYCQSGAIAVSTPTNLYTGEELKFRFATFSSSAAGPEWERLYRLMQGWAALAGMRYMDGSNGECGTQRGCGLLTVNEMNALWTSLDYDMWIWDWVLGTTSDPSTSLYLETTMATKAIYADNGYSDPYYDAQYNVTLQILEDTCRRKGGPLCTGGNAQFQTVTFNGNGALSGYPSGQSFTLPYTGTDGMQQQLYDFASYNILLELAIPYVFHELTWSGFGDWNVHRALSPDLTIYWLYFQISPNTAKAPIVSELPAFQALSGAQVTLTALATDSDGPNPTLSYTWDINEGVDTSGDNIPNNDLDYTTTSPSITIRAPTITDPFVTYGVNVRITDGQWTQKLRSTLTVFRDIDLTKAPDIRGISSTPSDPWVSGLGTDPVTLFGSAASRAGGSLTYKWTFGDGFQDTSNNALVRHTYSSTGTFTATLFVTDGANSLKSQFSSVVTVGINFVPFVSDLPTIQTEETTTLNFTALASDRNRRDVVTYVWDFGDGTPTATGAKVSHAYATGTSSLSQPLTYSLTATDSLGQSNRKQGQAFVVPFGLPNSPPAIVSGSLRCLAGTVDCSSTTVYEHQKVTITFQASDPEGNGLASSYTLGNNPAVPGQSFDATARNQVVTFSQVIEIPSSGGNLRITAFVTDKPLRGTPGTNSQYITIAPRSNTVPTSTGGITTSPSSTVSFGTRVTYTAKPSDANDATLNYKIDFGDGTSQTGTVIQGTTQNLPHDYAIAGTMNVVYTLTDPHGASSTSAATTTIRGTLGSFPFPFASAGLAKGNLVIGLSQAHLGLAASNTIDVVGAVSIGGAVGASTSTGLLGALLDTEAVASDGSRVTATGDMMGLGGKGSNAYTKLVNSTLPVRQAGGPQDGTGFGVYASETRLNYRRTVNPDGSLDDYALFAINFDTINGRYNLAAVGLSGFATRGMTQLIALDAQGQLTTGHVLTGTGVVVKLHSASSTNVVFTTYQVVDGSGGAVTMANPAAMPSPARIARLFGVGLSQIHGVAAAASTIDVVGGVTLGSKMGRDAKAASAGVIWAALDTEMVSLDGTTLLNTADNLVALGGRGSNLVTRYYNPSLLVRRALATDGTGLGIYDNYSGVNYPLLVVRNPDGSINYVQDYASDSYLNDAPNGNRVVEVVAGLSGFATRQASISLADGSVSRGSNHGIVISLLDFGGDNKYEQIGVADTAP